MSIVLKSNRLELNISNPGEFYRRSRFDWTGFITDVTLDNKHTFCADESLITGSGCGGRGLCNEFGISGAIGYNEVSDSGNFPKIGIGILEKQNENEYSYFKNYNINPFLCDVESTKDRAVFTMSPFDCNGYSVKYIKEITIFENKILMDYKLTNTGNKKIDTDEYCHNFVCVNNQNIGSVYHVLFNFKPYCENVPDVIDLHDNYISWNQIPQKEFYLLPSGFLGISKPSWQLLHIPSGVGMREICDFEVSKVAIWGQAHVVSPEMFIKISLNPGEMKHWTRTFEFFA